MVIGRNGVSWVPPAGSPARSSWRHADRQKFASAGALRQAMVRAERWSGEISPAGLARSWRLARRSRLDVVAFRDPYPRRMSGQRIIDGLADVLAFYRGDVKAGCVTVGAVVDGRVRQFKAVLHRGANGYGVSFPDVPGCMSVGSTVADAIEQGRKALAFHLRGMVEDGGVIP
jgi:predicted RNase H-like HicB family nuclease